ncbi:MAG TPA: insulinase family protein [Candidatus Paceibacterota bacterium]|nr:insulinase family protein [Candidatus Paceibacterota bacterium]
MQDRLLFERTMLGNGTALYSHAMDAPLFSLHVLIPVGSVHSHDGNSGGRHGVTHFLEHMTFMRSERYPELRSFDRLAAEQGALLNAYTAPYYTSIYVQAPVAAERMIVEGIASMLFQPIFDEGDIAIERGVVGNERDQRKYFPGTTELGRYIDHEWMHDEHFTKEQLFGSDADLAAMTPVQLSRFHDNYWNESVRIVAAGGHDPHIIAEAFGSTAAPSSRLMEQSIPLSWGRREYHEKQFRDLDSPILFIGGLTSSYDLMSDLRLTFILGFLTNPSHGPIYDWLRNQKGWTYGVSAGSETDRDRFSWLFRMPLNDVTAVREIRAEFMERARTALADEAHIRAHAARELNRNVFNFQTADTRAETAVTMLTHTGTISSEAELVAILESMTAESLLGAFDEHFAPERVGEFLALPMAQG